MDSLVAKIKKHPFKTFFIGLLFVLLILLSLTSQIVHYVIVSSFEKQGATVKIENIDVSLWQSTIEISGLQSSQNEAELNLNNLLIDWQWRPLFSNKVIIDNAELNGFKLDLVSDQKIPQQIGPFVIDTSQDDSKKQPSVPSKENEKPSEWMIRLVNLSLTDLSLCLNDEKAIQELITQSSLTLNKSNKICTKLTLNWQGLASLSTLDPSATHITGQFNLNNVDIKLFNEDNAESLYSHGALSLQSIDITPNRFAVSSLFWNDVIFGNHREHHSTELSSIPSFRFDKFSVLNLQALTDQTTVDLKSLEIEQVDILTQKPSKASRQSLGYLSQISSIELKQFNFSPDGILFDKLLISQLKAFESQQDEALNFDLISESIQLSSLNLNDKSINLDSIIQNGINIYFEPHSNGTNNFSQWFSQINKLETQTIAESENNQENNTKADNNQADEPQKTTQPGEKSAFKFNIAELKVTTENSIRIKDKSLSQEPQIELSKLNLTSSNINNQKAPFNYQLKMLINDAGLLESEGEVKLDQQTIPDVLAKLKLSALDLVPFSAYAIRYLGYRIDQGHMNINGDIKIQSGKIDSEFKLKTSKFELSDLEDHEEHALNAELGVPLSTALTLLENNDDEIKLEIPIHGDADSPNFSVADVISTVTVKAIKAAIVYQYSPFGLLTLANGLIDLATGLNFDPIVFSPGEALLTSEHKNQLEEIAQLTRQKPQISIVFCGKVSLMDLPNTEDSNPASETSPEEKSKRSSLQKENLSEEQRSKLHELAKQRQANVISSLKNDYSVPQNQILSCNIKVSTMVEKVGKVTISI
ncbi:DUF748 domain-containing protein [Pleionea sediminis]|uniref:DUF748 domain-containing protein n=1 Tax=Pleionea sediminis TaxID=2569479 RepID=UPI00118534F4|nr:DUF748 domain-containing protein [Pleionea sediminis]